jgi:hypothetical protein
VLWQQASHLLLKYTNLGYGTVLTAVCARQGLVPVVLVFNEAVFKLRFNIVDNSVKHGDY